MEQKVNIPAEEAKENIKRIFDSKDKVTKINENKDEKIIPINEINKKYNLLIVPGSSFGCPGHFRLSYCISYEKIEKSLQAFTKLAEEFK